MCGGALFTYLLTHNSTINTSTQYDKREIHRNCRHSLRLLCGSSLNAATIPAGTTLGVQTVSSISSKDAVGRTFEARLDQDVTVKGNVLLKAGTKAFGKIKSSRANPRKSEPLTLELTSISVNGRNVAVKTNSAEPGSSPRTPRQARYGHTAGTLRVDPGTKMQFQLTEAVSF